MKVRNLEEQVLKNAQDIQTLKSGIKIDLYCGSLAQLNLVTTEENIGKYVLVSALQAKRLFVIVRTIGGTVGNIDLGLFPAVVTGATGEKGETGASGKDGTGIYGCTATLPPVDSYKEGDFYILYNGDVYKKISNHWFRQTNIKGAQGPVGLNGTVVIPNPEDEPTDTLHKASIDGTVYKISSDLEDIYNCLEGSESIVVDYNESETAIRIDLDQDVKDKLEFIPDNPSEDVIFGTDDNGDPIEILFDTRLVPNSLVQRKGDGTIRVSDPTNDDEATTKKYVDDHDIIENLKDADGNFRFAELNLTDATPEGMELTYAKMSLSGTHLLIVVCGHMDVGTTINHNQQYAISNSIPSYIRNKIVPLNSSGIVSLGTAATLDSDNDFVNGQMARLLVSGEHTILVSSFGNFTAAKACDFRFEFNILIDNENE